MVESVNIRLTAAEFWEWVEGNDQRFELIDGEAILMATPIPAHQITVGSPYIVLSNIAKRIGG